MINIMFLPDRDPKAKKKDNLYIYYLNNKGILLMKKEKVLKKKQKDIIWYHVLDQTILTCGRCTSLFPL